MIGIKDRNSIKDEHSFAMPRLVMLVVAHLSALPLCSSLPLRAALCAGLVFLGASTQSGAQSASGVQDILLAQQPLADGATFSDPSSLTRFYATRRYRPAWTPRGAATVLAVETLTHADREGLDPRDYAVDALARLRSQPEAGAEFDVLLTDGLLHYARDVRIGRSAARNVDPDIDLPSYGYDAVPPLAEALATGTLASWLSSLPPPQAGYVALRSALARYRSVASEGGWPAIDPAGEESLRERLAWEEILPASVGDALRAYQARNGLTETGELDMETMAALNVPASRRIDQILANMERWRWLPRDLGPRYIIVNAADATLAVMQDGRKVFDSRVVAGTPQSPTPIFAATIAGVTVNPVWDIPLSVAREDILPRLRENPRYLRENHIQILNGPRHDPYGVSIDWRMVRAQSFSYRLRQSPRPDNQLGRLELVIRDPFDVTIHDTPARARYAEAERHLSHGCMHAQEILPLGSYALTGDVQAAMTSLNAAIASGQTRYFAASEPLPVYVLYWTAMADADGVVEFRDDVYGRDVRLTAALAGAHASQRVSLASSRTAGCERA